MRKGAVAALAVTVLLAGCGDRPGASAQVASKTSSAVVLDAENKLVWLRCAIGQNWQDGGCAGEALMLSRSDAHDRVQQLNAEKHQGIDQWRLPDIVELAALRKCDHGLVEDTFTLTLMAEQEPVVVRRWCAEETTVPTIDAERFPDTPPVKFWSRSGSEQHQVAYAVSFGNAWIGINEDADSPYAVRPVADRLR
ncbi:MAG: DUF1566 domain-containing protein [Variovorax sp.]|nr:MAG: DUF1566 domain-containing protein [Variovorax sp.]